MRRKPALFDETKKIAIAIVSDPWEIIETRPLGYPRNVYSYPRIVYITVFFRDQTERTSVSTAVVLVAFSNISGLVVPADSQVPLLITVNVDAEELPTDRAPPPQKKKQKKHTK